MTRPRFRDKSSAIGAYHDPRTGQSMPVYDPASLQTAGDPIEDALRAEIESSPERRLAEHLRERREKLHRQQLIASRAYQQEHVEPLKRELREIRERQQQRLVSAIARLGEVEHPRMSVDLAPSLDDLRENFERDSRRWIELQKELCRVQDLPMPDTFPGMSLEPLRADVSAHAFEWLLAVARGGLVQYCGDRELPNIWIKR